ncbi:uncharacterized protein LOC108411517 isoform X2 [Pygocentrus nattereri]|uniref:uncharacterized protein LOC108411517 isoform X2 n=1 Tax=Pygocentrus nattereri TaxID=42514 RepID=UPI0018910048|nr:uncharacterized protein LOC108411517 isoform X2 [Pygocentrus nattereri]
MSTHISNNKTKIPPDEEAMTLTVHASVSRTGYGFLHLKRHLKEMASVRQALTTGRPLVFCLKEQDKVPPHKPKRPMSTKSVKDFAPTSMMSMQQHALSPAELEIQRRIRFRRQDHILEKMEWIYKILCALNNMKNKDLKTLVPLSSGYVNIIMKDMEKTNILLKHSHRCLISSPPTDEQNNCSDMWETLVSTPGAETKCPGAKPTGYKPQLGLRRRAKLKELENDAGELPPWLNLLSDENVYVKNPQTPKNRYDMLQKVRTEFLNIQRSLNNQMMMDVTEKIAHQEERMKSLLNALMASRKDLSLPMLLASLKSEVKEPQSPSLLWPQMLQKEAAEIADVRAEEYSSIMQKIGQFHSFSHKTLPYCKERFCLLVLSLPANHFLRPAMQDALLFLAKNVLQLPPRKVKHWFHYLKLPLYDDRL